ncbi:MAG: ATP-binding protein [Verrucomicrobia bacterium]|nr:ATP-binding protein [Verrucomicrobiota bacterium]
MQITERFVNREREVDFLGRVLSSDRAEFVLLYGRRRVGKTALLKHVAGRSATKVLYHVAVQTTQAEELNRLSIRLAEFFKDDFLRRQPLRHWESLWIYLGQKASDRSFGIMLDEFPYAVEGDSSLLSILQHEWDRQLQRTHLKLILCGSSISMMERLGLSESSPLYGRRTGQWRLLPFGPQEFNLLWRASNLGELLAVYCVTGGNPLYIGTFDKKRSLLENIRRRILSKGCLLYDEVPFLLRQEVRDPRVYQAILATTAGGVRKFSELSSKTGLDKAHLTRYLAILIDLGVIEREVPVTEIHPDKSRRGLYRIADPFISFWYRFVFPNRDRLELGETEQVLRHDVQPSLDEYIARTVEPHLGLLFRTRWRHLVPFEPAFMGRYWDHQHELDWLILDRDRKNAVAVEIKWSRQPVCASKIAADLKAKVHGIPALNDCQVTCVLISRMGFRDTQGETGCTLISLQNEKVEG